MGAGDEACRRSKPDVLTRVNGPVFLCTTSGDKAENRLAYLDFHNPALRLSRSSADDTQEFADLFAYCRLTGARPVAIYGEHVFTATLVVDIDCDLGAAIIEANATSVSPVIRVGGNTSSADLAFSKRIVLPKITNSAKTGTGWTGFATAVGVELANIYQSEIFVRDVNGFGVGVTAGGYGTGFSYKMFACRCWIPTK